MPEEKKDCGAKPLNEGYVPFKKGHQPKEGNLDSSNPPLGGSGVPSKESQNDKQGDSDKK